MLLLTTRRLKMTPRTLMWGIFTTTNRRLFRKMCPFLPGARKSRAGIRRCIQHRSISSLILSPHSRMDTLIRTVESDRIACLNLKESTPLFPLVQQAPSMHEQAYHAESYTNKFRRKFANSSSLFANSPARSPSSFVPSWRRTDAEATFLIFVLIGAPPRQL